MCNSYFKTTRLLISGESGTGKELAAHMIHSRSRFSHGPFIAVNCAALPSELVESELFGHTAGAFTGAARKRTGKFVEADGGSIFLDEISEMSPNAQSKILRVLETQQVTPVGSDKAVEINCNVIAASNRNLTDRVEEGKFRQDLLFRLNVVEFRIPPLREHPEDIGPLAEYFLAKFANESGAAPKKLSPEALEYAGKSDFPGNIRELKNLMERVNIYCEGDEIVVEDLRGLMPHLPLGKPTTLKAAVSEFAEEYIRSAIAANDGNITETARQLGIERSHLHKKLKRHKG